MTGEKKKRFRERFEWALKKIEGAIGDDSPGHHRYWQIACIMRSAAGLPYSDTPASGWREEGTPEIFPLVNSFMIAAAGLAWENPKSVSDDLFKLRHSLRDLKRQILSIDQQAMFFINRHADPIFEQYKDKLTNELYKDYPQEDSNQAHKEYREKLNFPDHQTPIEATLEQMEQLEKGLTQALEEVDEEVRDRNDMGQLRTYAAKRVALGVAQYMYQVNGKIPGLWTGDHPSGPYANAVLEIFDILKIPSRSFQRAGEYAIKKLKEDHTAKLKSNPEF